MGALIVPLWVAIFGLAWERSRRLVRRWTAEGHDYGAERAAMDAAVSGCSVVIGCVAGPPLAVLSLLHPPRAVMILAGVPLALLGLRVNNRIARRRPDVGLRVVRWPDELRTLRTPAGRVALGLVLIAGATIALALVRGEQA